MTKEADEMNYLNRAIAKRRGWKTVPDFAGDVKQALKLLKDEPAWVLMYDESRETWRYSLSIGDGPVKKPNHRGALTEYANTPSEAICKAWLAWQDRTEERWDE